MGKMSKTKGKVGERECAALLREYGFEARRGQQFAGGGDSPDVVHSMPGFHVEVKRCEQTAIAAWLKQARSEAKANETAVIFHRKNNGEWVVILDARDFLEAVRSAA